MYVKLRILLKAFEDFKNRQKSVWSNVFCYVKYVHSESVFNTLYIEIKHMLKNSSKQNKWYKKCLLFSFASSNSSQFTFNLQFLYELEHKVRLSKIVCEIFHFRLRFVFIKVHIFFNKILGNFDLKTS